MKQYLQIITILIFFAALGFVGYLVWQSQQDQSAEDSSAATVSNNANIESATVSSWSTTNIEALIDAYYPTCSNTPVKIELYYNNQSHGECYANTQDDPNFPRQVACLWRIPIPLNETPSNLKARIHKINTDTCTYSNEFQDYTFTSIVKSPGYLAIDETVTKENDNYKIVMDRKSGTIYELYNKNSAIIENLTHAHAGAAIQIAIHAGQIGGLGEGCNGQGYWNPTQAGAMCSVINDTATIGTSFPPSIYSYRCDGGTQNAPNCFSVNKTFDVSSRMPSFDYTNEYEGPYNPLDTSYMFQNSTFEEDYIKIELGFENKGTEREAAIGIPGVYTRGNYTELEYFNDNTQVTKKLTYPTKNDSENENLLEKSYMGNIFTISDPNIANSETTFVLEPKDHIEEDTVYGHPYGGRSLAFSSLDYFYTNVISYAIVFNYKEKPYRFNYYIFPYNYEKIVETPAGKMSIKNFADLLAASENQEKCEKLDQDGDNTIKISEIVSLVSNFKKTCTADPSVDYGICGSQDSNGDGSIKITDVVYAVNRFKTENCTLRE